MVNPRPDVDIRTSGFNATERALIGLWHYDPKRAATLAGKVHLGQAQDRIKRGKKAPDGSPWAPLSERYKRRVRGGSMLFRTGELHDSLFSKVSSSGIDEATATVGTTNVKGVHDNPKPKNPLPRRQFLGLSRQDMEEINRVINRDLARLF